MADIKKLDKIRPIIRVSASISNWKDKILKRFKADEYDWRKHRNSPVTFFGFYNPKDWLHFWWHKGKKTIWWCGSDILQVGYLFRWLQKVPCRHICENEVEQGVLRLMLQQEVEVRPTILSNPHEFKINYYQQENPEVYLHINKNAGLESGFFTIERIAKKLPEITFHIYGRFRPASRTDNINFHGFVPEQRFNEEIKNYQAGLRLHEFDGFSEVIAKSVLMGQYPISRIRYPLIDTYNTEEELIGLLRDLKNKKKPNTKARDYYLKEFCKCSV